MSKYKYTIQGKPKAQQRPRFSRRNSFVTTYDPAQSVDWKNWIKLCVMQTNPVLMCGPLSVEIKFSFLRPKSLKKSVMHHLTKPDLDNLAKLVLDALTGILWIDDKIIIRLMLTKQLSDCECTVIYIDEII